MGLASIEPPSRLHPTTTKGKVALGVFLGLLAYAAAVFSGLSLPASAGAHTVGRHHTILVDSERLEMHTTEPSDVRSIPLRVWYPAIAGSGYEASYLDGPGSLEDQLGSGSQLGWFQLLGLSLVRAHARDHATPIAGLNPIVVLSPGNQTNVIFYSSIAEDLASRGYVVIGIDHPYQVGEAPLHDGGIAFYDTRNEDLDPAHRATLIKDRVLDIRYVLDHLSQINPESIGMVDPTRVFVIGHSSGGLAAAEACRTDERIVACVNIDGQGAGGPFGADQESSSPSQPFLFITKERNIHPELASRFEARGRGAIRAVLPEAAHDDFTDGALFGSALNPLGTRPERVMETTGDLVASFLEQAADASPTWRFEGIRSPTDIYLSIFPLGERPPIPRD